MYKTRLIVIGIFTLLLTSIGYSDSLRPDKTFNNDKTPEEEFDASYQSKRFQYWLSEAKNGDAHAMYVCAYYYETGLGIEKDMNKSYELYKKAADNKYHKAYLKLALFKHHGKNGERNIKSAVNWYRKSIDEGNNDKAMLNLSLLYLYGHGVEKNEKKAIQLLNSSAKLDNISAMIYLANYYQKARIPEKAKAWYEKAGKNGSEYALFKLGLYYEYSKEKDYKKAEYKYKIIIDN